MVLADCEFNYAVLKCIHYNSGRIELYVEAYAEIIELIDGQLVHKLVQSIAESIGWYYKFR